MGVYHSRKWVSQAGQSLMVLVILLLTMAIQGAPASHALAPAEVQIPVQNRFEGCLKAKGLDKWLVGDISVFVDGQTELIDKRGPAEVGAWLIVWATEMADGRLHAELIFVERPAGQPGYFQLTNTLKKKSQDWLVVGDTAVQVNQETRIIGSPEVGNLVSVSAEQRGIDALALTVEVIATDPAAVPIEFEGTIEEIGQPFWRIAGQQVKVDDRTKVIGERVVGRHAEVVAGTGADGWLRADIIRILDQPAEVTVGALVAAIIPQEGGTQLWDTIVFAPEEGTYPKPGLVYVHNNTLVDESRAIAQPGQWAEVTGLAIGPDTYQADLIRVEQPVPVTISGEVEERPAGPSQRGWWRIGGRTVWVADAARLMADAQVGKQATVRGLLLGNGVVWTGPLPTAEQ